MREDKNGRIERMKIFKIWKYELRQEWKNGKNEYIGELKKIWNWNINHLCEKKIKKYLFCRIRCLANCEMELSS